MSLTRSVQTILRHEGKVLLGRWKTGDFAGRYTAPIKMDVDRTAGVGEMEMIAKQTVKDLTGVNTDNVERRCVMSFAEVHPYSLSVEHVFMGTLEGSPDVKECDLYAPEWFSIPDIPFASMPEDDIIWYHQFLSDRLFHGQFVFDGTTMQSCKTWKVDKLVHPSLDQTIPFM